MRPIVTMHGKRIEQVKARKILGLVFDDRLTWLPHIQYIRKRVLPRLKLLSTLAASSYGLDQGVLLRSFTSTIVSVIEFGSPAYGSARPTALEQLQTVFNEGLRIALGAFRTTAAVGEWLGRSSHNRATRVRASLEAMDFFNLSAVVSFSSTIFHKKGHQRNGFIRNRRAKAPLIESTFFLKKGQQETLTF